MKNVKTTSIFAAILLFASLAAAQSFHPASYYVKDEVDSQGYAYHYANQYTYDTPYPYPYYDWTSCYSYSRGYYDAPNTNYGNGRNFGTRNKNQQLACAQPNTQHPPADNSYPQPQQVTVNININGVPAQSTATIQTDSTATPANNYVQPTSQYAQAPKTATYEYSSPTTYAHWLWSSNYWYEMPNDESNYFGAPKPDSSGTFPPYFQSNFGNDKSYYVSSYKTAG